MNSNNWQPIETAPKDGAHILVSDVHGVNRAVVYWGDLYAGVREEDEEPQFGWLFDNGHDDPMWYRGWHSLRYWQPLPALPAVGWWYTICCEKDLDRITTEEQLRELLEEDDEVRVRFWPTREEAIAELKRTE